MLRKLLACAVCLCSLGLASLAEAGKSELIYGGEMAAQGMVFEPLVMNSKDGVKPWLAESWDISKDGKVYTFHLRKGVTFSDGTPFTAQAVKMNFDAILDNRLRHAWLDMMNEIERGEVLCDRLLLLKDGEIVSTEDCSKLSAQKSPYLQELMDSTIVFSSAFADTPKA